MVLWGRQMENSEHALIQAFVRKLGLLCGGRMDREELAERASAYADMLVGKYDRAIWTRETLQDVSRRFRYLPSLSELDSVLALWKSVLRVRQNPAIGQTVRQQLAIANGEAEKGVANPEMAARVQALLPRRKAP